MTDALLLKVGETEDEVVIDVVTVGDTVRVDVTEAEAVALMLTLELAELLVVRLAVSVGEADADALTDSDADTELEVVSVLLVDGDVPAMCGGSRGDARVTCGRVVGAVGASEGGRARRANGVSTPRRT